MIQLLDENDKKVIETEINEIKEETESLKENLEDFSYGHLSQPYTPLEIRGINNNLTMDTISQNIKRYKWNITSTYVYRGAKYDCTDISGKSIVITIMNNGNDTLEINSGKLKLCISKGENWGSPLYWFEGSTIDPQETKTFSVEADKLISGLTNIWVVVGSNASELPNVDITVGYYTYDSKYKKELNADKLDGKTYSEIIQEISQNFSSYIGIPNKNVVCYGDSLTHGAPVYGELAYPYQLGLLLGSEYKVSNQGIGGNTAQSILARQGAYPAIVQPFVIPSSTTPVDVILKSSINGELIRWANSNLSSKVNPVIIDGVAGNLTETTDENDIYHYTFTRIESGEQTTVSRPTLLFTNQSINTKNDIQILWIGQNGSWDSEDELVEMYKAAISYMTNKRYICIGLSSKSASERATLEKKMMLAFGLHYINIRDYLVKYGLDDAQIEPTEQDKSDISDGKVPSSLRADGVHFTADGYKVIAKVVYKRGKELGYW